MEFCVRSLGAIPVQIPLEQPKYSFAEPCVFMCRWVHVLTFSGWQRLPIVSIKLV